MNQACLKTVVPPRSQQPLRTSFKTLFYAFWKRSTTDLQNQSCYRANLHHWFLQPCLFGQYQHKRAQWVARPSSCSCCERVTSQSKTENGVFKALISFYFLIFLTFYIFYLFHLIPCDSMWFLYLCLFLYVSLTLCHHVSPPLSPPPWRLGLFAVSDLFYHFWLASLVASFKFYAVDIWLFFNSWRYSSVAAFCLWGDVRHSCTKDQKAWKSPPAVSTIHVVRVEWEEYGSMVMTW